MGLDMYLSIKRNLEFKRINEEVYDGLYYEKIELVGIGYWRKFNALHNFIVSNFAEVDDCNPVYLSKANIDLVLSTLRMINTSKSVELAKELMPPQGGFFFGSTEVEEWYFKDIERSIPIFELALKTLQEEQGETQIVYRASW